MKIASWNVNSLRVRLPQVLQWLNENQPDVLCLQELKLQDKDFPQEDFAKIGYHSYYNGQKTYNGVAMVSKTALQDISKDLDHYTDPQRRYIAGNYTDDNKQTVRIVNVYVPNGQALDSDKFIYKQQWLQQLQQTMQSTLADFQHTVLLGDFNIAPSDNDVYDPVKWRGSIHCSNTERLILHKLMGAGLYDTYRKFNSQNDSYSWWDYRSGGYQQNHGLRIDLILASCAMLNCATDCTIDETPRQLERPSDHAPVVAEFDLHQKLIKP